uniref:ribonuclease H n=3 Tax=Otus sunia TaxID=257818 RepID=A0A8C8AJU2_9STRI
MSAAVPDMLELQYELESKAAKWYATIDIANAFFSIPIAPECRPQFAFTWRGIQYTWNRLPQGWKHSSTICHRLVHIALEKGEAPEHLQFIDDIIVWGDTAEEVSEKGKKIIEILLKAGFAIKRQKVKGPGREIQFLGIKWQDGRRHIPMEVINKITAMAPPTTKKETQAFLGAVGFWRMHIPNYSLIVSPLYHVTRKKNDFKWGPEQQQAFEQIKQEITQAVALGPVRTGQEIKNVLYTAAGENGPSWSLWQRAPGESRGRPLGFWSRGYKGSEANYTLTEKEILAAYEGIRAASEVVGTETQLLLAPRLPVLGWMFKGKAPSTHHATDATWSKWVALITQRARIGNLDRPGLVEMITNWPESKDAGMSPEQEVKRAEEAPPYNKLPEEEKPYALFTDGSCRIVGKHRQWKAAVWHPTRETTEAVEGQGESSQFAEVKAIQLALEIAEREKWPRLYLYTDSWVMANALWKWLQQWKQNNWQRKGRPIWAAEVWQDIAARMENLAVKVRHVDAHIPKSRATDEHQHNQQADQAAKIEVAQVDLDWQRKGELFIARWAHETSGHQGRDATYRWARDRGVDLNIDTIAEIIHGCETCAAIKQAKRVKPQQNEDRWLKYKYGEAWQIDYITLPQTRQGKRHVLTMVEATTGWLETYPVSHATARNTILGLENQVLWRHGTPERIESDNGTHFRNNLIDAWAEEHGIEWVYHIPYHAPASGKIERYNGLLKTTLKAMGGGTFKHWDTHLTKATWLVNTRGSANRAGPAQSRLPRVVDGDKVPVVRMRDLLGKMVWVSPAPGKGKPIHGIVFAQGPGCTWWVMQKDGEVRCVPQGDLIVGENIP